jgi:hypothetical protein
MDNSRSVQITGRFTCGDQKLHSNALNFSSGKVVVSKERVFKPHHPTALAQSSGISEIGLLS